MMKATATWLTFPHDRGTCAHGETTRDVLRSLREIGIKRRATLRTLDDEIARYRCEQLGWGTCIVVVHEVST